jgi:glutaredoxin/glutathione-dependent peroxiredoxin
MSSISVGTDMLSSVISLQKARPWYQCKEEGSNMADDNAVTLKSLFSGKKVAMFGVPAPFTGTCTHEHYPAYKELADDILSTGVDQIVCYAVSDPYAMDGWQQSMGNDPKKITFLADPDASFAKAYGVDKEYAAVSLGHRSIRFSMIVDNGSVATFHEVSDAATDAQQILDDAKELKEHSSS